MWQNLPSDFFPSEFPTNTLHAELHSHIRACAEEGEEVVEKQ
jgi:hypothetical protein